MDEKRNHFVRTICERTLDDRIKWDEEENGTYTTVLSTYRLRFTQSDGLYSIALSHLHGAQIVALRSTAAGTSRDAATAMARAYWHLHVGGAGVSMGDVFGIILQAVDEKADKKGA